MYHHMAQQASTTDRSILDGGEVHHSIPIILGCYPDDAAAEGNQG